MSQYFEIHPDNPQKRLIHQAVAIIEQGGVIVYQTDSSYALGCHIGTQSAMERIQRIRQLGKDHNFTLVCRDLSEIALYAKVNNSQYRTIRALTPGPYTFIFKATHEVPRRLLNPKRKTIGIRVPDHDIANALLEALGQPLMSSTLILPESDQPMNDAYEIRQMLEKQVDLIIDGGNCGIEPTTVIVMEDGQMDVVRKGKGDVSLFE